MTFKAISRRTRTRRLETRRPAAGAIRLMLLTLVAVGFCGCQTPQSQSFFVDRARGNDESFAGRPQATPLPSPAPSQAMANHRHSQQQIMMMQQHQQMMQQQQLMIQQQLMLQQQQQQQRQAVPPQFGQAPSAPFNVVPVAFNDPVANRAAVAEVVSNSHPAPCTAPYCLPHGRTLTNYHLHGHQPRHYLPGPDAPNLGGFREDEFLCDGGDKDVKVVIGEDWAVYGLNLEDTVGHYDTLDGKRIVKPSNSVCIYAPRFAAVRQVRGAVLNKQRVKSAGVALPEQLVQHGELRIATTKVQQIQPLGELGRRSTVTFEDRTRGVTVANTLVPAEFANRFGVHENFQVIRIGIHQQSEEAFLSQAIEAAAVWETKQAVQVVVDKQHVHVQKGLVAAEENRHYEQHGEPDMRVIKVASAKHASPGDEVEFTIRFDNIGDEKIGNVTIIDNLTTRLEYVADSAQCNVKADFLTQQNEAESLILRWEITEPLEPGSGGIIRFKCRVR